MNHRIARLSGRDPHEQNRVSTPLELLFDLTVVVAFSQAGTQAAHYLELGDLFTGIVGFAMAVFAVSWAWINFSWLASAYDTDDIFFRIATLVEMIGVLVMALGFPVFFHSLAAGHHVDNAVMIGGYVVMRAATIALWLRAAANDPARRRTCLTYAGWLAVTQVGWIIALVVDQSVPVALTFMGILVIIEMTGPVVAERRTPTPWHAHHIAERYSLLVIITLGEVILGTILAISAVVDAEGWSLEAALVALGGTTLAFAMWWNYFSLPVGRILHRHRDRAFTFGYVHMLLFGAIAAVGAGLHVAANVISHEAHVDKVFAVLCVAVPVLIFLIVLFLIYTMLVRELDRLHVGLLAGSIVVLVAGVFAAAAGASVGAALLIVTAAPVLVVVGYELVGYRHQEAVLARNGA